MRAANLELYFDDPRLRMTPAGRFLVRFSFYVGYFVLGSLAGLFLLFETDSRFFWLGILLLVFILDRIFHIGEGEDSLDFMPKRGSYNLARVITPKGFQLLESSLGRALFTGTDFRYVLLEKLLDQREISEIIVRLEVKPADFLSLAEREFSKNPMVGKEEILAFIPKIVFRAFEAAKKNREYFIDPDDLFAGIAGAEDSRLDKVFALLSVSRGDMDTALIFSKSATRAWEKIFSFKEASGAYPYRIRHRVMNRSWTARPTYYLDGFSTDLTDLARAGRVGFMVGHEMEYERLLDVLSRPEKPVALLVGEPGMGKEAILNHLAYGIVKDNVPAPLFDRRLVELSIGEMVAGAQAGGELEARVQKIVTEIVTAGNVILYIPDIGNLMKTSGTQYLSAADILLPVIRSGAFSVIGGAHPREYKKYIEQEAEFSAAFEVVRVLELSEEDALKVITHLSLRYEREYKVQITLGAVKKAVLLAHKYFRTKPLPGSAEDLLREALADAVRRKERVLTADAIIAIAERKVNVPIHQVDDREAETLLNMESIIHERLVDQEEAVKAVSQSLREYRSGLSRKGGPIATFLFVGPTGVGKTELSKILAGIRFGSEKLMTRFDMTEYQDKQSLFRFIGSPDGAVAGALTDAILEKPYSLILLDEFEKAHPDILNLFLQVFDDGRLTDNLGRIIDFQNTIIIATSNVQSEFIQKSLAENKTIETISEEIKKNLVDYFKPELLNRFTKIIVFKTLSRADTEKIAKLQLKILADDLMEAQNVTLALRSGAVERVAELGYSVTFGARPLRRVIADKLRATIAEKILRRQIMRNDSIEIGVEDGEFVFWTERGKI